MLPFLLRLLSGVVVFGNDGTTPLDRGFFVAKIKVKDTTEYRKGYSDGFLDGTKKVEKSLKFAFRDIQIPEPKYTTVIGATNMMIDTFVGFLVAEEKRDSGRHTWWKVKQWFGDRMDKFIKERLMQESAGWRGMVDRQVNCLLDKEAISSEDLLELRRIARQPQSIWDQ